MRLHSALIVVVFAGFAVAAVPRAQAKQANDPLIPVATTVALPAAAAKAPLGWTDFCTHHPDDCDVTDRAPQVIVSDKADWTLIRKINTGVNKSVREASDMEVYGVPERWEYPESGAGDCEDFALMKRKLLIEAGLPRQALLIDVVTDENGAGHAVLTVRTDRGDYVLDNRTMKITAWQATGYGFVKQQSAENPNRWVRIGEPAAPLMTASPQN